MSGPCLSRRGLLRATAGATVAAGAAGAAAAQAGDRPDFGGWLDGVDGGFRDARGESQVTVQVGAEGNGGNFAFAPAGLWIDPGTTVVWEWTGQGSLHNVVAQEGAGFSSGDPASAAGTTFEHTFEEAGIVTYQCDPHATLGMKGAVAVGDDVPMAGGGSGGNGSETGGSDGSDTGGSDDGGSDGAPADAGGTPPQPRELPAGFDRVSAVALGFMGLFILATLYLTLLGVREDRHAAQGTAEEE